MEPLKCLHSEEEFRSRYCIIYPKGVTCGYVPLGGVTDIAENRSADDLLSCGLVAVIRAAWVLPV